MDRMTEKCEHPAPKRRIGADESWRCPSCGERVRYCGEQGIRTVRESNPTLTIETEARQRWEQEVRERLEAEACELERIGAMASAPSYRAIWNNAADRLRKLSLETIFGEAEPVEVDAERAKALEGLPDELVAALEEPGVFVPQDSSVFKLIAEWADAPSNTTACPDPDAAEGES